MTTSNKDSVSIIITVADGEQFVNDAMKSILDQSIASLIDLDCVIFLDDCKDKTLEKISSYQDAFNSKGINLKTILNETIRKGVGYGRNRAIEACSGQYLCFLDIDDIMYPQRIELQLQAAKKNHNAIIGSQFVRPDDSTKRFTEWANILPQDKLTVQIYTTNGPTIIMPTWFCHRKVFERIPGGFDEGGRGVPEDLIFFYKHLDMGGDIERVEHVLLFYNYHKAATTFSINESTIFTIRLHHLLHNVLNKPPWTTGFTIWNAGKAGKHFFKSLPPSYRSLVKSFCDVDINKVGKSYRHYDPELRKEVSAPVPIIHFKDAQPPLIICMKLNLTNGAFEENLKSLNLVEGMDYILFP